DHNPNPAENGGGIKTRPWVIALFIPNLVKLSAGAGPAKRRPDGTRIYCRKVNARQPDRALPGRAEALAPCTTGLDVSCASSKAAQRGIQPGAAQSATDTKSHNRFGFWPCEAAHDGPQPANPSPPSPRVLPN
ncbi:MAG: hypothetical protein RL128_1038, partial [Pseudomonadota bacterium]